MAILRCQWKGGIAASTRSCVAVGTASQTDRETRIRVASPSDGSTPPARTKVFEGSVELSSGVFTVASVFGDVYFERQMASGASRLEVSVDDEAEPSDIYVRVIEVP
jgi:hypothetical protein